MAKIYLLIGTLALSGFGWAQYKGVGLFDDVASGQNLTRSAGRTGFHK